MTKFRLLVADDADDVDNSIVAMITITHEFQLQILLIFNFKCLHKPQTQDFTNLFM